MKTRALLLLPAFACSCAAILKTDLWSGDLIKAPHEKHQKADVGCVTCHEEIFEAKTLEGNFRPPESKCMECHQDEKDKGNCGMCHTDAKHAHAYAKRERTLNFSHAAHIPRVKEDCTVCHKVLPAPTRSRQWTPKMEACTGCHNHEKNYGEGRCDLCHKDLTRYQLKPIADFSHDSNFVREHARPARASSDTCALCHEQTFCADCHAKTVSTRIEIKYSEKVESDFIHRGDWITRHPLEAKYDSDSCRRCHGTSFCDDCHTAQNLTPHASNPRDPHPAGWSFPTSQNFHGPAARRDIASCAACHDQGARSICVDCHKVGGIGGNPHPKEWLDHHSRSEIDQNSMCRYCHSQ